MSLKHVKNIMRVAYRAEIPVFLFGAHGIGKTSAAYQMYQEAAAESDKHADARLVIESAIKSKMLKSEDLEEVKVDISSLSSLDGRYLARAGEDLDALGFWSMSGPNLTLEELVGMPHVTDRGKLFEETYLKAQDAASRLLASGFVQQELNRDLDLDQAANLLTDMTEKIFAKNCARLGITEDDRNHLVLRYLRMYGLMPDPRHRGGGVWLIDEPNRAFQEVEKALMQILLERRYLDYIVPDGVWICMTMNPPGGDYQVREMDMATLDRGLLLTVTSDSKEFLDWSSRRGLSESSQVFVDKHADLLNAYEQNLDMTSLENPGTYRSVEFCDRGFSVMTEAEVNLIGRAFAIGLLGQEAGQAYYTTFTEKGQRALTAEDVFAGYGWSEDMTFEQEADFKSWPETRQRKALKRMVNKANVKTELVHYTLKELKKGMDELHASVKERGGTRNDPKMTREEKGRVLNMLLFLCDLPVDISRAFVAEDLKDVFSLTIRWTGTKYPVARYLMERTIKQYKQRQYEDEDEQAALAATGT